MRLRLTARSCIAALLIAFIFFSLSAQANNKPAKPETYRFISKTGKYAVTFPVPPGEEVFQATRATGSKTFGYSKVRTQIKKGNIGKMVQLNITMEPLPQYGNYEKIVVDKANFLAEYYQKNFDGIIKNSFDYTPAGRWGKELEINFYTKDEKTKTRKAWAMRSMLFYSFDHIFQIDAIGSEALVYSDEVDDFFNSFVIKQ